jgi:CrcB protein
MSGVAPPIDRSRAALVAAGGALGATCRWGAFEVLGDPSLHGVPWPTLLVNMVGSAVLVWALVASGREGAPRSLLVDGLGTGFCGGLTTFSAFAVGTAAQVRGGAAGWAALSIAAMLGGAVGAAALSRAGLHRGGAA